MTPPRPSCTGLSSTEAARRLDQYGPNDPTPKKQRSHLVELLLQFANPLVAILLFASIVSAFVGELLNATIVIVIVFLSVAINFVQTFRSQRSADRLRATVAPTATVLRDGLFAEIHRVDVVPGDVVRLSAGDLVPADARLLEARDLHVQQSALTGESMPVEKNFKLDDASEATMVLLGTSVVSGTALALVLATGARTTFGDIATRLRTRAPDTEFDRGIRQFGTLIMKVVFGLVMFILIVRIGVHRSAFESVLFAVALAVGLTPEFLPMITSVTLARGAVAMAKNKVIVKHLSAIQNLGSIDVLCSDKTGTLTRGVMCFTSSCRALGQASDEPVFLARLNSKFETGIKSPLDAAMLEQSETAAALVYSKVDEIPFDFERRRLSVVVESGGRRRLISKGAPEGILQCSSSYSTAAGASIPLDAPARAAAATTYQALSARGYRVLAVATCDVPSKLSYGVADEAELVLSGFVAFSDPPREGAKQALQALKRDGVEVKILTGDNELVTRHICAEVGLDVDKIVLGDELEAMNDLALAQVAERTAVFARMSPSQKNRVIVALKQRSHVVGYLGDGINDAPSLHAADVGISVSSAVDVARDAADIILLEEGLLVLHRGILEGRRAFGNVTKYLLMGTSSNFGNMFSMAAASVFLPFLPMLPMQVLLNNLLYDLAQLTIPTDNVDPEVLQKPQRWDIRTIRNFMLIIGPISSLYDFLTFYVLLYVFQAGEVLFHTGWFVESLATQTLVLFVIRTPRNPLASRPSMPLIITTLAIVLVGAVLPFSPVAGVLGFEPLPAKYFVFLACTTVTYLLLVELAKRYLLGDTRKYRQGVPIAST
ncbi:MAG: magnesium-translocating P-type ATPase [Myxococcaceae bacterium]|nr:magnesium-translocating P-type ATPase [Myxococcaceae bacterium]